MNHSKGKEYNNDWPIVALCYDFDKTLSPQDMQNFKLIPKLKCGVKAFWKESNKCAKDNGMDRILSYMKLIIDKGRDKSLTRKDFQELGESIELFPGVDSWFDRINAVAFDLKINLEHYIISAGLKEILEGTKIANYFTDIYASEFLYNQYGEPVWPCQVVNYTSKTQYLFRINKDCPDLGDEESVNEYFSDEERRIPFQHFIYIGDSESDIPAMRIVKKGGGYSIGVYNPHEHNIDRVKKLLQQERINYFMPANYSEDSGLEHTVINILKSIRARYNLVKLGNSQMNFVNELDEADDFIEYAKGYISDSSITDNELKSLEKQSRRNLNGIKKDIIKEYETVGRKEEIDVFFAKKSDMLKDVFDNKKKKINKKVQRQKNMTSDN